MTKSHNAFYSLLKAGLFEQDVRLSEYEVIDFNEVYKIASEQSVAGLVVAGLEHVVDVAAPKDLIFAMVGETLQLEQRNKAMNAFIAQLFVKLQGEGIHGVLIKGQGAGQCYTRPLWRACGDVDLFFDKENYEKAKIYLSSFASHVDLEDKERMHLGMNIDNWIVELHGTMHSEISNRMDLGVDLVQQDIFENGGIRKWDNDGVEIALPNADNDVIIVFTHFLHHFYIGGIGLRQICDWCRLLWVYKDSLNHKLLESRISKMGLMQEWKCFGELAVKYLGMPKEAVPLLENNGSYHKKARRVMKRILETGNMGHNIDESYRWRHSEFVGLMITFGRRLKGFIKLTTIFPHNTPVFFTTYVMGRAKNIL